MQKWKTECNKQYLFCGRLLLMKVMIKGEYRKFMTSNNFVRGMPAKSQRSAIRCEGTPVLLRKYRCRNWYMVITAFFHFTICNFISWWISIQAACSLYRFHYNCFNNSTSKLHRRQTSKYIQTAQKLCCLCCHSSANKKMNLRLTGCYSRRFGWNIMHCCVSCVIYWWLIASNCRKHKSRSLHWNQVSDNLLQSFWSLFTKTNFFYYDWRILYLKTTFSGISPGLLTT